MRPRGCRVKRRLIVYTGYFHFPESDSLVEVLYLDPARLPVPEAVIRPSDERH